MAHKNKETDKIEFEEKYFAQTGHRLNWQLIEQYGKEQRIKELRKYANSYKQPCGHKGCFHHISHPCEHCGRMQGYVPTGIQTDLLNRIKELNENI